MEEGHLSSSEGPFRFSKTPRINAHHHLEFMKGCIQNSKLISTRGEPDRHRGTGVSGTLTKIQAKGRRIRECFSPSTGTSTSRGKKRIHIKDLHFTVLGNHFLIVKYQGYFGMLCLIWRCETGQRALYNTAFGRSELKECLEKRDGNH